LGGKASCKTESPVGFGQVVVEDGSSSEVRPVWGGAGERQPKPLSQTTLERSLMRLDWDRFAQRYA
jgi:hypothetical protein